MPPSHTDESPSSCYVLKKHAVVDSRQALILDGLTTFFADQNNFQCLKRLIGNPKDAANGEGGTTTTPRKRDSKISLRLLEFVCSNYSKSHAIEYKLSESDPLPYNVHVGYCGLLEQFSKRNFDCFARRDKIVLARNGEKLTTTAAQLHFMRWAIQKKVLTWCENHLEQLRAAHQTSNRAPKGGKKTQRPRYKIMKPIVHYGQKRFKLTF